jgi:phosphoribulokinase
MRPIVLGVVGDSAAGKTTITRGLVRILGEGQVTAVATDDYHRYDRRQRSERGITPLHPDCNYMDIMAQHLRHLRRGEAILKPVYVHADGTFGPPVYVDPNPFAVVEGLLGYHDAAMRDCYDVRVYLAPPEDLRRRWKVQRDTSRRGYTTDQVARRARPARGRLGRAHPSPGAPRGHGRGLPAGRGRRRPRRARRTGDPARLAASPRPRAVHRLRQGRHHARGARVGAPPGDPRRDGPRHGRRDREAIWSKLHFATHLRSERLGEYTIGTDLHRSESLALVQLLILYHLVTAKAAVALGGEGPRVEAENGKADEAKARSTR